MYEGGYCSWRSYSLNNRREKGTHESNTHKYTIIIN